MYILYAQNKSELEMKSHLFEQHFEPLLQKLDKATATDANLRAMSEIPQYQQVCRWPFRKLEYSFALAGLLDYLKPGMTFLDAGSGVTPLANVLSLRGVTTEACDGDPAVIAGLQKNNLNQVYNTNVRYSVQDLTKMEFADETFDAVACISVLEHIPAPFDQKAVKEMLRVLKPGGVMVLTLDFTPDQATHSASKLKHYAKRALSLTRDGKLSEVVEGASRRLKAGQVVKGGEAKLARTANQCFAPEHLTSDIIPLFAGQEVESKLQFATNLNQYTAADARNFWQIDGDLFNNQGQRSVLPAATIIRKAAVPESVTSK